MPPWVRVFCINLMLAKGNDKTRPVAQTFVITDLSRRLDRKRVAFAKRNNYDIPYRGGHRPSTMKPNTLNGHSKGYCLGNNPYKIEATLRQARGPDDNGDGC